MTDKIDVTLTKIGVFKMFEVFRPLSFHKIYVYEGKKKAVVKTINDSSTEDDIITFVNSHSSDSTFRLVKKGDENRR